MISSELSEHLRACYAARPEFAELFRFLAAKKRSTGQLVVSKLAAEDDLRTIGSGSGRKRAVLDLFKELQELGVGALIVGRRGKQTRFKWAEDVTMLDVARAALGEPEESRSVEAGLTASSSSGPRHAVPGFVAHQLVVRPGLTLRLDLPEDFSSDEAERLASFVRALPFPTRST